MYPRRELAVLAEARLRLRRRIARRREECAVAAQTVVQPLRWLDSAVALWRRITPLVRIALIPLGAVVGGKLFRQAGKVRTVLRWAPLLFQAVRRFRSAGR